MTRLFVHVGLPKTGTSYLQRLLAENRPALAAAGYVYPFVQQEGMFHGAVDVRRDSARWGLEPGLVTGTWAALLERARSVGGTAVVSHELLAGASPAQAAAALRVAEGFEVHVVVTVRDLARQLPAHWQEAVKNGSTASFADVTRELLREPGSPDTRLWEEQDLPAVLDRWAGDLPPERVHLVVCPPRGAPPDELWRRFSAAIGLPPGVVGADVSATANESLGPAEVALLREVNAALGDRLPVRERAVVLKRLLAQGILAPEVRARVVAPEQLRGPLTEITETWAALVRDRGYAVHGPLADLTPRDLDPTGHPDAVPADAVAEVVPTALAGLLTEVARLRT